PGLPADLQAVLPYASLNPIQATAPGAALPPPFQTWSEPPNWCYYFEKADLARQTGAWDTVAAFADRAFNVGYPDADSKHVSEYEVFIEGYARTNQWEKAWTLSMEAVEIDPLMAPMICDVWERSTPGTPTSTGKTKALESIRTALECKALEADNGG
ncbi:MAG: hypothetical protein MUO62_02215, partial [Anaerolineales bacterium]|nr:hypothetical protein [Anaerolineales bacterium]